MTVSAGRVMMLWQYARARRVVPASELRSEEEVYGVQQVFGEIRDGGIVDDHPGIDGPYRGEYGSEDPGVHHTRRHRAALVNT
jgi:hypothetical protein